MTVIDSSVAVDLLLGGGVAPTVEALAEREGEFAAPDVIVFELLSAIRRLALRGLVTDARATAAVQDIGALPLDVIPSIALRERAFALRRNLTAADALFVALAELLDEPLVTKDESLAAAARRHTRASVAVLRG